MDDTGSQLYQADRPGPQPSAGSLAETQTLRPYLELLNQNLYGDKILGR